MFELLNQQIRSGQREFTGDFFQKLTAFDGALSDYFGYSVSVTSDASVIVVGAYRDDDKGTNSGSAYVFTRQANGSYLQVQKVTAPDGAASDFFGYSVSVSGNGEVIAIGAYSDDDKGTNSGSVYIFTKQANGSYAQTQKLTALDGVASDFFGQSVSVSGDGAVVVVGAYYDDDKGDNSGSAYIFTKQANGSYSQKQKLTASDGAVSDFFGQSVSVSGDGVMIAVGAYYDDDKGNESGSAYIFTRQANGSYAQTQKLIASDGAADDYFGYSVSMSTDASVIVVGAHGDDDRSNASGSVYIFIRQPNGGYLQAQKLVASDGADSDFFGYSVSVSGNGEVIAIGAYGDDDKGSNSGSTYIFTRQANGSYLQTQKLIPLSDIPSANMGVSVAVSDEGTVVTGAYAEAVNGIDRAGSVYIFK